MGDKVAVITGFGAGLSEETAIRLLDKGYRVAGLSRSGSFGNEFKSGRDGFHSYACDVGDSSQVQAVFETIRQELGHPTLLVHNAALLLLEDFLSTMPDDFESLWRVACLGAVNVTQQVLPHMLDDKEGVLIYTGATASVKAGAKSPAFSSAKFALRGLAQSLARAYGPEGIHVVHTVLDGVIWGERAQGFGMSSGDCMDASDIADSYMALIEQKPSAWTHEIDMRPYKESF